VSLCPDDCLALDAILENGSLRITTGQETGPDLPNAEARALQRAVKIQALGSLLDRSGHETVPHDLVTRTLESVREAQQKRRFAQQVQALGVSRPARFQWGELMTVAAVLLIAASLIWPVMERVRSDARRVACANNLAIAGQAFGRYASDHGGVMPRGKTKPGTIWWNVGARSQPDGLIHSNSAHLYILVRAKYINPDWLRCPDNPSGQGHMDASMHDWRRFESVSYSYQNQYTRQAIRLDQLPEMAILADKNPLFVSRADGAEGLIYRSDADPSSPSIFHKQQGQNILTSSLRVIWKAKPVGPNGDNIWLIKGVSAYRGVEAPHAVDDSFLVP